MASSPSLRGRLGREQRETRARTRVVTRSLSAKNPGPVLRGTLSHAIRRELALGADVGCLVKRRKPRMDHNDRDT